MKNSLTKEQLKLYYSVLEEFEHIRTLSREEKEALLLDILSRPFIDLLCDWAFKHVFGHNEQNLMLLLNDLLPETITGIEYDPNEIDRFKGDDKNVIMDVLCHTEDGRKIIVEMQRHDKRNIRNRLLYYGAAMTHQQLAPGADYGELMPVYVICFMNFRLAHEENKLVYTYTIKEEGGEVYGNQITIMLCELPRLMKKTRKKMTPVEIWFDILQNMTNFAEKPEEYGAKYNSIFESSRQTPIPAQEKQQYLRSMFTEKIESVLSDEDRQAAWEEGKAAGMREAEHILSDEDRQAAWEEGEARGEARARESMAKKLKELGIKPEDIAKASGLSVEEVAAL